MLQHLSHPRAPAAPASASLRACATLAEYERFHGCVAATCLVFSHMLPTRASECVHAPYLITLENCVSDAHA